MERDTPLYPAAVRGRCPGNAPDCRLADPGADALMVTLKVTGMPRWLAAILGGVGLAVLFTQSRWLEMALLSLCRDPAGYAGRSRLHRLILIYMDSRIAGDHAALRLDRGVFPDPLQHHARPQFRRPQSPRPVSPSTKRDPLAAAAVFAVAVRPALFSGWVAVSQVDLVPDRSCRGGVSSAGTGGLGSGLAFRILEAGYRLNIPRMFAALFLIAATGVVIYAGLTSFISHMLLRKWHESAAQARGMMGFVTTCQARRTGSR